MYKGPMNFKTIRAINIQPILDEYFTISDVSNISIRQIGTIIKHNLETLLISLANNLKVDNFQEIKTKLEWLKKFTEFDIYNTLALAIKKSTNKKELIKYLINNLIQIENVYIVQLIPDANDMIDCTMLLQSMYSNYQDSKIIIQIKHNEKCKEIYTILISKMKSIVSEQSKLDYLYFVDYLHDLDISQDIGNKLITNLIQENFLKYEILQSIVDRAIQLDEIWIVTLLQNNIEQNLSNQQLIYELSTQIIETGIHPFVERFMISKLNQSIQFHSYQLQMYISKWITTGQKGKINTQDYIQNIKYYDELIVVSNYYWNNGQVQTNILDPLENVTHPLKNIIKQKFQSLKTQHHQICQLFQIIIQIKYQEQILYLTIEEYNILVLFQKQNIQQLSQIPPERLITSGVLIPKKNEFEFQDSKLLSKTFQDYSFAHKPKIIQQKIEIEEYEQNKKAIIEAGIMKIMKQEKKLNIDDLFNKVVNLIKKSVALSNVELKEYILNLIKRDLLCMENELVFYNI